MLVNLLTKEKSEIINSLKSTYKNSYSKKILSKAKKFKQISIIGMGGSILGTEAIHSVLKHQNWHFGAAMQASTTSFMIVLEDHEKLT